MVYAQIILYKTSQLIHYLSIAITLKKSKKVIFLKPFKKIKFQKPHNILEVYLVCHRLALLLLFLVSVLLGVNWLILKITQIKTSFGNEKRWKGGVKPLAYILSWLSFCISRVVLCLWHNRMPMFWFTTSHIIFSFIYSVFAN